eukprot:scaffold24058_cov21-Tisochrysis_lutea.AAC.3
MSGPMGGPGGGGPMSGPEFEMMMASGVMGGPGGPHMGGPMRGPEFEMMMMMGGGGGPGPHGMMQPPPNMGEAWRWVWGKESAVDRLVIALAAAPAVCGAPNRRLGMGGMKHESKRHGNMIMGGIGCMNPGHIQCLCLCFALAGMKRMT